MSTPIDVNALLQFPITQYANYSGYFWIVAMGTLIGLACGFIGIYLVLRRMALIGDAISHSLLPGVVIAFLITGTRATWPMFIGGLAAGFLTNILIDFIYTHSRVKVDAAIGIVFSTLFAFGIILMALFADHVDLDLDCVLYGEIGFVPLAENVEIFGYTLGPLPVIRMAFVAFAVVLTVVLLYKELLITSFDPGHARSVGISSKLVHAILTAILSLTIVSAFEAVGSILVIAMLIFPGTTALLMTDKLNKILYLVALFAFIYSSAGLYLALTLDASIAGSMGMIAGLIFLIVWVVSPKKGLLRQLWPSRITQVSEPK